MPELFTELRFSILREFWTQEIQSHIITFTANLRGRFRSKRRRRPQCAQLIMYTWRLATMACAANSLIDLMMGDLETFVKSLNAWSGISDAVKWRWWIPESCLISDFICEVTEMILLILMHDWWISNYHILNSIAIFTVLLFPFSFQSNEGRGLFSPVGQDRQWVHSHPQKKF